MYKCKDAKCFSFAYMGRVLIALVGVVLIGFGLAFNSMAALGNDPLAVFFDGVRNAMNLPQEKLGTSTMILNIILGVIVFFAGRKYIRLGTFIYVIPLGFIVNFAFDVYKMLGIPTGILGWKIFSVVCGCLMIFTGLAAFIVAEIGLDPWTGGIMILCDKTHKSYKFIKVTTDIMFVIIGFLLGGVAGWATLVAAFVGGPCISFICKLLNKAIIEPLNLKIESK